MAWLAADLLILSLATPIGELGLLLVVGITRGAARALRRTIRNLSHGG